MAFSKTPERESSYRGDAQPPLIASQTRLSLRLALFFVGLGGRLQHPPEHLVAQLCRFLRAALVWVGLGHCLAYEWNVADVRQAAWPNTKESVFVFDHPRI